MPQPKWVGSPLKRKEDPRLIRGKSEFINDINVPGMLHAVFIRSPYAHARIKEIDISDIPTDVKVFTGKDIKSLTSTLSENTWLGEPSNKIQDYILAVDKVRYVGDVVALVVAPTRAAAEDASELVKVEYDPLPPVVDPEMSMESSAPLIHEDMGTNVAWHRVLNYGDAESAFAKADKVVKKRLYWHRFSPAPLETTGVIASYDPLSGMVTIWSNNQRPAFCLPFISHALKIPQDKFRMIVPDIGGGFGVKTNTYSYMAVIALASMQMRKPIKWIEERSEHLMAHTHGNEVLCYGELGVNNDGTILGLKCKLVANEGAFMRREPLGILNMVTRHGTSIYNFQNFRVDVNCVLTNKSPISPMRSYGKMQQCWFIDRLIDTAAKEIGMDPAEMRLKNFVTPQQMPYTTPTGAVLDGGDYALLLKRAMERIGYANFRKEQEALRRQGRYVGIGIGVGVDGNPVNVSIFRLVDPNAKVSGDSEAAYVEVTQEGKVIAATGSVPQGQGHETVISQVVADELGVHPDNVNVLPRFDSLTHPSSRYSGTYASRFTVMGFGALIQAIEKVKVKMREIAANLLEANVVDLEFRDASVYVKGTDAHVTFAQIGEVAWQDLAKLPKGIEPGLVAESIYTPNYPLPTKDGKGNFSLTYCPAIHVALVEVDPQTGRIEIIKYVAMDDPGTVINPMIVEGQLHGAYLQQLSAALYEDIEYDNNGELLTSNFMTYLAPSAADMPTNKVTDFETISTRSLFSVLGARGVGEGGGSPIIAVANAVQDAVSELNVSVTQAHLSPEYVWNLIHSNHN